MTDWILKQMNQDSLHVIDKRQTKLSMNIDNDMATLLKKMSAIKGVSVTTIVSVCLWGYLGQFMKRDIEYMADESGRAAMAALYDKYKKAEVIKGA